MEIDDLYNIIRDNIKRIRKINGDSQEELANKINMSRGFISQIESSKVKAGLSIETLLKIANIYNIDISELFKKNNKE